MSKKLLWIVGGVVMIAIIIWFVMGSGNSEAEDLPSIDVVEDVEEEVPVVTSPTPTPTLPAKSPVPSTVVPVPFPTEAPWEQGPSDPPVVPPPSGGGSSSQTPWGQGPSQ